MAQTLAKTAPVISQGWPTGFRLAIKSGQTFTDRVEELIGRPTRPDETMRDITKVILEKSPRNIFLSVGKVSGLPEA